MAQNKSFFLMNLILCVVIGIGSAHAEAAVDDLITEKTKGMSDQEKNQFYVELEEEINKMCKMSDAELNKYIQDAENEFGRISTIPQATTSTSASTQPVENLRAEQRAGQMMGRFLKPRPEVVDQARTLVKQAESAVQRFVESGRAFTVEGSSLFKELMARLDDIHEYLEDVEISNGNDSVAISSIVDIKETIEELTR